MGTPHRGTALRLHARGIFSEGKIFRGGIERGRRRLAFAVGADAAGDDRTRCRSAALPQAERHAAASFPSAVTGERHRPWLASPRTANEAPSASADGAEASIAEARGSEKERADTPVAAGEAVGTSATYACLQYVIDKSVCLRVVPTVGISVGTPVGITVGIFWGSMGHRVGTAVGIAVGIPMAPR